MTDNEIIKALRAVAKKYEDKPVATFEINIRRMTTDAADHIERLCDDNNRQKAEIERWKEQNVRLNKECDHFIRFASTARTEAIREFADRLKLYLFIERGGISTVSGKDIDNLVKEMTEDKP